jgi:hypothetical protein
MKKLSRSGISIAALATASLLFSGCSSKQYFEPEQTYPAVTESSSYGSKIVTLSRNGATLEDGHYIGKNGVSSIVLGEGYRFLNENASYVLAGNTEGVLKVINKKTGKTIRTVDLHVPIVSAAIQNGLIAYVLNSNTFGIYEIAGDRKLIENRSESTFAIDTRAANPMFIDTLAVMPMLDGKLVILNPADTENVKVIYISSERAFNNVIYLSRMDNTMVAATPKRLITLGTEGQSEYRANISEVAISKGRIYLFTKEGEIIKLDTVLNELAKQKFRYAHFSVATVVGGKVYALDQKGSLIVLSPDLSKYKIYEFDEVETPAFITGSKLYKDGEIIDLSKLGYE